MDLFGCSLSDKRLAHVGFETRADFRAFPLKK
jgi:hypothetical protein